MNHQVARKRKQKRNKYIHEKITQKFKSFGHDKPQMTNKNRIYLLKIVSKKFKFYFEKKKKIKHTPPDRDIKNIPTRSLFIFFFTFFLIHNTA